VCQGVESSQASRYVLYVIPGLFALFLALRLRGGWLRQLATGALALLLITGEVRVHSQNRTAVSYFKTGKAQWQTCYLERGEIAGCDRLTHFAIYPRAEATRLGWKLGYLRERRLNLFKRSDK